MVIIFFCNIRPQKIGKNLIFDRTQWSTDLWKLMVVRASFKSPATAAVAVPLPRPRRSSLLVSSVSLRGGCSTSDRPNPRNTVASGNPSSGRQAGQRNAAAHSAYSSMLGEARGKH